MVIDINILRIDKGGDPTIVLKNEQNRFKGTTEIEKILKLDEKWRNLRHRLDSLNRHKNLCSKEISSKMKKKEFDGEELDDDNIDPLAFKSEDFHKLSMPFLKTFSKSIEIWASKTTELMTTTETKRQEILNEVGNFLHPSVVISQDENDNEICKTWGNCTASKPYSHVDLLLMLDAADYRRGINVAGNRGYFLKGPGVLLSQALINYALKKLVERGYTCLSTPFFIKKAIMKEVAQLSQFDDELYKVSGKGADHDNEDVESYLIATSEQPIAAYHRNEWLNPDLLPLRYAGLSSCFRKEVGSHGRDTAGIFRVHQFEKVEQFVICSPENGESWKIFEEMMKNSEEYVQDLKLGYRIVSIVSGSLNNAASKKLDLEAWFPKSSAFRELVSCSNCTDYQARSLGIRYGQTKQPNKETPFVHMLNGTMCAVTRVLCCLVETHQTPEGVNIPECLHPYLPENMKFVPFKNSFESLQN